MFWFLTNFASLVPIYLRVLFNSSLDHTSMANSNAFNNPPLANDCNFLCFWNNLNSFTPKCSLYTKARIMSHKRGKRNTRPNQSLIQIEGVDTKEAAQFYLGKVS